MIYLREMALRLRERARGRLAWFRARQTGKPLLHFIHLGKTGGTAIKHALTDHACEGKFHIVLHEHDFTLQMVPSGEVAFFILRDPIARFTSGFASRQRQGLPRYHYPWSRAEKLAFSRFSSAEELALALGSPDEETRSAAEHAMLSIRHVRDTYVRMLGPWAQIDDRHDRIMFVGFQHRLDEDFARFRELAGLPPSVALPTHSVSAHRSGDGEMAASLSAEARQNLEDWYAQDIAIYNALLQHHAW